MSEGTLNSLNIPSNTGPTIGSVNSSWSFSLGDSLAGGEDAGGFSGVVALIGILGAFCGRDESHKMHKPFGLDGGGSMMSSVTHMRSVQSSSVSTMRFSS